MSKLIVTTEEELRQIIDVSVQDAMRGLLINGQPKEPARGGVQYLNVKEAAQYLKLSVPTLYGYTKDRKIPFLKPSGQLMFIMSELDEWLTQGRKLTVTQISENLACSKSQHSKARV